MQHNFCIFGNAFPSPALLLFPTRGSIALYDNNVKIYKEFKAIQYNRVGLVSVHTVGLESNISSRLQITRFVYKYFNV